MSVAIVAPCLSGGGAERVASIVASYLDRSRIRPVLCLLRGPIDYAIPRDVEIVNLEKKRPWHVMRAVTRLRDELRRRKPDVVLSMTAFDSIITGLAMANVDSARWVARIADAPRASPLRDRILLRRLYRRADSIVAGTHEACVDCAELYSLPESRFAVLPNPVDFALLDSQTHLDVPIPPRITRPRILAVGRLVEQKRYDILIDAFYRVSQTYDASLCICGTGPLRQKLERHVESLGLSEHVHFVGYTETPAAYMRRSDIFVLASDHEGLPNALIEAQGLGVPAVSTDCRYGPREIIVDGATGFLVSPGSSTQLADRVKALLSDSEMCSRMAVESRKHVRARYGVDVCIAAWSQFLTSCDKQSRRCRPSSPSCQ
ncbi:MAG: glycosyltransferase [Planctomycetota bacterium]